METKQQSTYAFAGYCALSGAISMLVGAAFWGASGTDLWQTLANNQMEEYLAKVGEVNHLLVANTSFWILGVLLMGAGGTLMAELCHSRQAIAKTAVVCMRTAVPLAIVSFITMLSVAMHSISVDLASLTAWIGTHLDDLATMLIVGIGPYLISIAGSRDWVPRWLKIWGYLAGLTGLLVIIGMLSGNPNLTFIIVPVGIGWMIAAGIVLIKKSKPLESPQL